MMSTLAPKSKNDLFSACGYALRSYQIGHTRSHLRDNWYMAKAKDYPVFAKKYPMNGELQLQKDKIKAMHHWCDQMKIRATPTLFINGYELPESYQVNELKKTFSRKKPGPVANDPRQR